MMSDETCTKWAKIFREISVETTLSEKFRKAFGADAKQRKKLLEIIDPVKEKVSESIVQGIFSPIPKPVLKHSFQDDFLTVKVRHQEERTTSAVFEFAPGTEPRRIEIPPPDPAEGWELDSEHVAQWGDEWYHSETNDFSFEIDTGLVLTFTVTHFAGQLILKEYCEMMNELHSKVLNYSTWKRKIQKGENQ